MRILVMLYSVLCYLWFFIVFVYFMAFVGDLFVPKTISSTPGVDARVALIIDLALILLWGIQHSVMARPWFKNSLEKIIPQPIERSTYVLVSALVLAVLMFFWQPIAGTVWEINKPWLQQLLWALFALGWVLVFVATFLTDHFDLFGLRQSWLYFLKKTYTPVKFTEKYLYRWIRHPMMTGLFLAFWCVPTMTRGHLVFSIGMSVYILVGIYFEEKTLTKMIGQHYTDYQQRTAKILPKIY